MRHDLADKLRAMTVERGCTPAEAETARKLLEKMEGQEGLEFYRMMLWYAVARGYKPGWAAYRFKDEFGHWPRFDNPEPLKPDESTLDYIDEWRRQTARELRDRELS